MIPLDPADPVIAAWRSNRDLDPPAPILARRANWRRWARESRARRALAAGRLPGRHRREPRPKKPTGRPRTSTHPRAAYWRAYYARNAP
ncbi:MAG: hypothetical protein L6R48_10930 [Planctomycetes bacterium]|nr:hypothetical protein [Planctomycetota bacterium]